MGTGKALLGQAHGLTQVVLGGWMTSFIATAQDGQPFTVGCSVTTASGLGCNALLVAGQHPYQSSSVSHFVNAAAFANPAVATTIGQTDYSPLGGGPTQVTGPPYRRIDLSLVKRTNVTQRVYSEFRVEFFNITNTANFANPSQLNIASTTIFGRITSTVHAPNDPRQLQFALKLYW